MKLEYRDISRHKRCHQSPTKKIECDDIALGYYHHSRPNIYNRWVVYT